MTQILVFGHSLTWGAWDIEGGGWVNRLQKYFAEHANPIWNSDMVYNLGVSGNTTEGLLERFEVECKTRVSESLKYGENNIIIFNIGANDSIIDSPGFRLSVPQRKFESNIRKLIKLAKKFTTKIVFVGSFPMDETKSVPIAWNKKLSYKNERIEEYDSIVRSVCEETRIPFVDTFNMFINSDYKSLLADGVHPNSAGHEKIFEIVRNFLIKQYPKEFSYLQK